ncbi:UNVERIFIED_CONTAM: hypothetical protein FKN15_011983 [Acipenser sinensis]
MVSESVGAPKTQKMDLLYLIEQITKKAVAQGEQLERWGREMELALQERREPTELELLLQEWEQASGAPQPPEPEGEELPLPEPRGEEPPLPEPEGRSRRFPSQREGAAASGTQGGGKKHTSTTAPTSTPKVQFGTAASSPSPLAPGHPAGLSGPPCAGPRAQECTTLATALPLIPCFALPEHPDVAGLLADVAVAPPVRCFASPG